MGSEKIKKMFVIFQRLSFIFFIFTRLYLTKGDDNASSVLNVQTESPQNPQLSKEPTTTEQTPEQHQKEVSRFEQFALGDGLGVFLERSTSSSHAHKLIKHNNNNKNMNKNKKQTHNKLIPQNKKVTSNKNKVAQHIDLRFANALSKATKPLRIENEMLNNFRKQKAEKLIDFEKEFKSKVTLQHHKKPEHVNKKVGSLFL
eukprot:c19619_g2_i1.p1 GENE.c19619_g2_i1~~c19619_g2_i1.p1  ORF type:complete len:201 (-),score=43.06 c19619_g2_i1:97-699(-)